MIGGVDYMFCTSDSPEAMERAVKVLERLWPDRVIEDADSDLNWSSSRCVPFGRLRELFVYESRDVAHRWAALGAAPSLENTMVHLLRSENSLTVVLDDPDAPDMKVFLSAIAPSPFVSILNTLPAFPTRAEAVAP